MPYYNGDPKRDQNFDNHPYAKDCNAVAALMLELPWGISVQPLICTWNAQRRFCQAMRSVRNEGVRKGSGVVEDVLSLFRIVPRNNVSVIIDQNSSVDIPYNINFHWPLNLSQFFWPLNLT